MCLTTYEGIGRITSSTLAISHTHTPNKGHLRIMDKSILHQSVRYIEVPLYTKGGWSRFSQNVHLIFVHHMQCTILLTQRVDRVAWAYVAACYKRALIRIRDQPPLPVYSICEGPGCVNH
jgi:hypothetical protein